MIPLGKQIKCNLYLIKSDKKNSNLAQNLLNKLNVSALNVKCHHTLIFNLI